MATFCANKTKGSEAFSKQSTQLIVELNSSLRHIIVTKVAYQVSLFYFVNEWSLLNKTVSVTSFISHIVNQISVVICFYGQKLLVLSIVRKDEWSFNGLIRSNYKSWFHQYFFVKTENKNNYWSRETSFSVKKSKQKLHNIGEENWREQDLQIRSLIWWDRY